MRIKKFNEIKSTNLYDYGCVMIEIPFDNWNKITSLINKEDIYYGNDDSYGIQDNPHLTLFYGLHDDVTEEMVKSVFDNIDKINIKVKGIGIFENKDFDVVKLNVISDEILKGINRELSKFPNSNEFPDYSPHITIGYVKKGMGKKYLKQNYEFNFKNIKDVCYSLSNGDNLYFEI